MLLAVVDFILLLWSKYSLFSLWEVYKFLLIDSFNYMIHFTNGMWAELMGTTFKNKL